jgi:hypothetical protein
LEQWLMRRRLAVPGWLAEHRELGLPTCDLIKDVLGELSGLEWEVVPNVNAWMHLLLMVLDLTWWGRIWRAAWRVWPASVNWLADIAHWGETYRKIYIVERLG